MNITYTERNGELYAYECTSRRVPGRNNPVSCRRYLGKVDKMTGSIIPPGGRRTSEAREFMIEMGNYGNFALLIEIAKRMGLVEDFRKVFGEDYKIVLAVCMTIATRPSSIEQAILSLRISGVCMALGIRVPSVEETVKIFKNMDNSKLDDFINSRLDRCGGATLVYHIPAHEIVNQESKMRNQEIVIGLDGNGIPLVFTLRNQNKSVNANIEKALLSLKSNQDCVLMSISDDVDLGVVSSLLCSGNRFAVILRPTSTLFQDIRHGLDDTESGGFRKGYHKGETFPSTRDMVLSLSSRGWGLSDSSECDWGYRVDVRYCYDQVMADKYTSGLTSYLSSIVDMLDGKIFDNPQDVIGNVAGSLSIYLRYRVSDDGRLRVSLDSRKLKDLIGNYGTFAVLSSGVD